MTAQRISTILCLCLVTLAVLATGALPANAQGQSGTTLSADKTADGILERTFHWTIDKSVTPSTLDMFTGDSGTVQYTIRVTKDAGTDKTYVQGQVCVTNGGAYATENLKIVDEVQYKVGSGQFQTLAQVTLDLGANTVLAPGETHCYPYQVNITPVADASYRNVAHVTITNHAGHLPGGNLCPGTDPCPFGPDPKADFSMPSTPNKLVNDSINVDDSNGSSFGFSGSGSESYPKTFTCDADEGAHKNTATIRETGQSASISVQVNCYKLNVTKDAQTAFNRKYNWSIQKSADQSSLTLSVGQTFPVNYTVTIDKGSPAYVDSGWKVTGNIHVANPAPINATLNSVSDVVSGNYAGTVDCGVTFPYTLAAGTTLDCTYSAALPNADSRTNTATATLQNTPSGTTDFTGTAAVTFGDPTSETDKCISVSDTLGGSLGTVCITDALPKVFQYSYTVGPYTTCGGYKVDNTATFTTNDTGTTGSASWTVNVTVPCNGCTLTIGYWKTHAGFGPQPDVVTPLLPQSLGTSGGAKTQSVTTTALAVQFLSFDGSNNVFDASNGINKLYAQLLAAKLNIAYGAAGSAVASTITAADTFLATHNSLDWGTLTKTQKTQVLSWATTLDNYNNGLIGPGHCSETGVTSKLLQVSGGVYAGGSNVPQAGVKVQIYNTAGTLLATVLTNKYGQFVWRYSGSLGRLVVRAPGYGKAQKLTVGAARQVVANWIQ